MEIIASLRAQLDRLCADPSVDPNWMLQQLSAGLRERYRGVAVGFLRRRVRRPELVELLGLAGPSGEILVPVSEDFRADQRHPSASVSTLTTELWFGPEELGPWRHRAVDACFGQARSAFVTPLLVDRPQDWHIMILSPIAAPAAQRRDRALSVTANLLAANLLRALDARRLARANAWIERELDEIARLQKLLQPEPEIRLGGVDIAYASEIFQYAGGDYFDIPGLTHLFEPSERHPQHDYWGTVVADVSGHGPSAAVEAAMVDAIMRTYRREYGDGPETVMGYLNRNLFTRRPRSTFVTCFLCNYRPVERVLRWANAGHPPPVLRPRGEAPGALAEPTGIPLRVLRDYTWTRGERAMVPGDLLLIYTDGVTESRRPQGEELGTAGLAGLLDGLEGSSAEIVTELQERLHQYRGEIPPRDDQTLIVIQWT